MAKTLENPAELARIEERLRSLRPDAPALWGTMSAGEMLCHLGDALAQAVGRREMPDQSSLLFRTVVRFLVVNVLPMPKGAPTAPSMSAAKDGTRPAEFEADRERVLALVRENAAFPAEKPFARHPAFGSLSHRERGLLSWKHLDHHLRQFGA